MYSMKLRLAAASTYHYTCGLTSGSTCADQRRARGVWRGRSKAEAPAGLGPEMGASEFARVADGETPEGRTCIAVGDAASACASGGSGAWAARAERARG
jgi:hypothetical protein